MHANWVQQKQRLQFKKTQLFKKQTAQKYTCGKKNGENWNKLQVFKVTKHSAINSQRIAVVHDKIV